MTNTTANCIGQTRSNESGAVLLEAVPVVALLLFISLVGIDMLRLGYSAVSLQFAATRAAREAIFPNQAAVSGPVRAALIERALMANARTLGVAVGPEHISICTVRQPGCAVDNAGTINDLYTVEVRLSQRGFVLRSASSLGSDFFEISARVIARNEP